MGPQHLAPGSIIGGRYELLRLVGRGGMGEVYEARHLLLDKRVAVKLLPPGQRSEHAIQRFLRQGRLAERVRHQGIVHFSDSGLEREGEPYVVMEWLDGQNLAQWSKTQELVSLQNVATIGWQLCDVLAAVHLAGIVHRDIKPHNVFISTQPDGLEVKLLDFGIARLEETGPRLTATSDVLGTLAYMAPEQLGGARAVGMQADIYGFSALLFELLTGRPPLQANTWSALRLAIAHDPIPDPRELRVEVPSAWATWLMRGLAKKPQERPRSAAELRDVFLSFLHQQSPGTAVIDAAPTRSQPVGPRFQLGKLLGTGGQGQVYEARDLRQQRQVALKLLTRHRDRDLLQLKQQFRMVREISHPNLVRLFELTEHQGNAFICMELVHGSSIRQALEQQPAQLMSLVRQLVEALCVLHGHRLVHRDLKPDHVLVTHEGRVVLIDFGLTVSVQTRQGEHPKAVAGTLAYMAPEALEGHIGPAGDLFALGALLQELLFGAREPLSLLETSTDAHSASILAGSPLDHLGLQPDQATFWRNLCRWLLHPSATDRPSARQVWSLLAATSGGHATAWPERPEASLSPFVGRERELALLQQAYANAAARKLTLVSVLGRSAIGKTALLERFIEGLPPQALVLQGVGRRAESIPFPALDAWIDGLADHLLCLPSSTCSSLVPPNLSALVQLFPVLARFASEEIAASNTTAPIDPSEIRPLAFDALRHLLVDLSRLCPLVLVLDDWQWIDSDSRALLSHLFGSDMPPPGLLLIAQRCDDAGRPEPGASPLPSPLSSESWLELRMQALSQEACITVVEQCDPRLLGSPQPRQLAECSGGDPMLLRLLLRLRPAPPSAEGVQRALDALLDKLPATGCMLLEWVALSTKPLPREFLLQGTKASVELLDELVTSSLLRTTWPQGVPTLEVYHARVQDAVLARLGPEQRRDRHKELVRALSALPQLPLEAMVEHLAGGGRVRDAAAMAEEAALAATRALAFERAAELYRLALDCEGLSPVQRSALHRARAHVLEAAGQLASAAHELLATLAYTRDEPTVAHVHRQAGEWLLLSGDVEAGLALLEGPLLALGLRLPRSFEETLAQTSQALSLLADQELTLRRPDCPPSAAQAETVDLHAALAEGLNHMDLMAVPHAVRGLQEALVLGDTSRLQRACANFVWGAASLTPHPLQDKVLRLCKELTPAVGTDLAAARLHLATGEYEHLRGQFLAAATSYEEAERILLKRCRNERRLLSATRNGIVYLHYGQVGDYLSRRDETLRWLADAEARGDLYHENFLRCGHALLWLARDNPTRAREEIQRAEARRPGRSHLFATSAALFMDVVDRYECPSDVAVSLPPAQGRPDILNSPVLQSSFLAGYIWVQHAWCGLRNLALGRYTAEDRELVDKAQSALRCLSVPVWTAIADVVEANHQWLLGHGERSESLLLRSEGALRSLYKPSLAAVARLRRGEFLAGRAGAQLRHEAEAQLRNLGIVAPTKWARAYFSPFPADGTVGHLTME